MKSLKNFCLASFLLNEVKSGSSKKFIIATEMGIFHEMKKEFPEIFWRSKSNNPINKFYLSKADGYQKTGEWDIFWMGINDYSKLNECINFAVSKQQTISY